MSKAPFLTFVQRSKCNTTLKTEHNNGWHFWTFQKNIQIEPVMLLFSVWIEARGRGSQILADSADSGEYTGCPKKTFRFAGKSAVFRTAAQSQARD